MAKKHDKLSLFIMCCVVALFILGARKSMQLKTQDDDLRKSFKITEGSFVDCGVGKTADFGRYTFTINNQVHKNYFKEDKFCFQISAPFCDQLKKYNFPVAYNPDNPDFNKMILSKNDFRKYKITRADSLSKVFEQFFDCR